jgi:hypothetical protein
MNSGLRYRIRDGFIVGSSCTIVLVRQHTWGRKYMGWEIKQRSTKSMV